MIDLILESSGASISGNTALKLTKSGKPKKVSDRKGKPTANGDFIKKIRAEHADELKAFQETAEKKQGAHLVFVSNYKKAHPEEYSSFVAAWTPNRDDSETASTVSAEESIAPAPAIAATPLTQAKKPVKKAQKAQAESYTPVVAPIQASIVEEMLPFTMGGMTYLRKGCQRPDGNHLWTSGHLWQSKKGLKGSYMGEIQADGMIDTDADEPSA